MSHYARPNMSRVGAQRTGAFFKVYATLAEVCLGGCGWARGREVQVGFRRLRVAVVKHQVSAICSICRVASCRLCHGPLSAAPASHSAASHSLQTFVFSYIGASLLIQQQGWEQGRITSFVVSPTPCGYYTGAAWLWGALE